MKMRRKSIAKLEEKKKDNFKYCWIYYQRKNYEFGKQGIKSKKEKKIKKPELNKIRY